MWTQVRNSSNHPQFVTRELSSFCSVYLLLQSFTYGCCDRKRYGPENQMEKTCGSKRPSVCESHPTHGNRGNLELMTQLIANSAELQRLQQEDDWSQMLCLKPRSKTLSPPQPARDTGRWFAGPLQWQVRHERARPLQPQLSSCNANCSLSLFPNMDLTRLKVYSITARLECSLDSPKQRCCVRNIRVKIEIILLFLASHHKRERGM